MNLFYLSDVKPLFENFQLLLHVAVSLGLAWLFDIKSWFNLVGDSNMLDEVSLLLKLIQQSYFDILYFIVVKLCFAHFLPFNDATSPWF